MDRIVCSNVCVFMEDRQVVAALADDIVAPIINSDEWHMPFASIAFSWFANAMLIPFIIIVIKPANNMPK